MNSRRYPKKSVCQIAGLPLISYILNRLVPWSSINNFDIFVAIEDLSTDYQIAEIAKSYRVYCLDGNGQSPKDRIGRILRDNDYDYFFRINGDSPFVDIELLQIAIDKIIEDPSNAPDFVTNLKPRTYPYGVSVELCKSSLFINAIDNGTLKDDENVFDHIYQDSNSLNIASIILEEDINLSKMRLVIDEPEDSSKINSILNRFEISERRLITWKRICDSIGYDDLLP